MRFQRGRSLIAGTSATSYPLGRIVAVPEKWSSPADEAHGGAARRQRAATISRIIGTYLILHLRVPHSVLFPQPLRIVIRLGQHHFAENCSLGRLGRTAHQDSVCPIFGHSGWRRLPVAATSTPRSAAHNGRMLETELQRIYDSEINVRIGWFWDCGIDVRLGDDINGYIAEENVASVSEIIPWLQEAIAHFYPDSTYAKSLGREIRERAVGRLFRSPTTGAQVRCPDCGAPHAALPEINEVIAFVCAHCGKGVTLPRPKVC